MLRVADPRVWNSIRWLYVGSGLLFLANIALGILNVFTDGPLPRGQLLAHLHSGTIGWITLGIIASMFWAFTGERVVSDGYAMFVKVFTIFALLVVPGYVMAFGLAFNGDASFLLLPIFGIPTALVIVASMVFAATQLKRQPVVTTVHLLFLGALIVASLGAIMGVLWGLTYETGIYPYPEGETVEPVGAHAGPMDMYLALAFAAIIEMMLMPGPATRWTKAGLIQTITGVIGGFIVSGALFMGLGPVTSLGLLFYIVSVGIYIARVGWRTFKINPFRPGPAAAQFVGGFAIPVYVVVFVSMVALYFVPGREPPHAFLVFFVHLGFVGQATNLLLAAQSTFAGAGRPSPAMERAALLTLNVGLILFVVGEFVAERRDGALVMALGAIWSLVVMWSRLGGSWTGPEGTPPRPSSPPSGMA